MTPQERIQDKKTRAKEAFVYEGNIYLGNLDEAVNKFVSTTSYPSDFHVWLQDNYTMLNN